MSAELETLSKLLVQNFPSVILSLFLIMAGMTTVFEIVGKFSKAVGKPVKWIQDEENLRKLTIQNTQAIEELTKQHRCDTSEFIKNDAIIREELKHLTEMFLDKQIDDMRYEILNFTSSLSSGCKYNREAFDHIFKIYQKYEKILEEHEMENGLVDESVKYINEMYHNQLRTRRTTYDHTHSMVSTKETGNSTQTGNLPVFGKHHNRACQNQQ